MDVLNVRKMFQLTLITVAVAGRPTDAAPEVVATRSEGWDQRRRNEGLQVHNGSGLPSNFGNISLKGHPAKSQLPYFQEKS